MHKIWTRLLLNMKMLRMRLFFTYCILIVITITLIGSTSYFFSNQSSRKTAEQTSLELTSHIRQNLDFNFEQIRNTLLIPYYNKSFMDGLRGYDAMTDVEKTSFNITFREYFSKSFYIAPRKDIVGFYIFMNSGELMYTSEGLNPAILEKSYRDDSWRERTISKKGRVYFSGSYPDTYRGNDRYLFSASAVIRDLANDSLFSIVRAEFKMNVLEQICRDSSFSKASKVLLLDEEGDVVYSTGNDRISAPFGALSGYTLHTAEGNFRVTVDGADYMLTHSRSSASGWSVVTLVPLADIFEASRHIKNATILIAFIALALTATLSFWFASGITKPVLSLYRSVNDIRLGKLHSRAAVHRDDEIGRIATSFNAMVGELETLIQTRYIFQLKLRDSELALLYSQINPHFLYNTLDSIRAMAEHHKVGGIAEMVSALADLFRYSISNDGEWTTVEEEVRHIRHYITIQGIRFGSRIEYELDIDPEALPLAILKITLQPLVENAVYHGLERKKGRGKLRIVIRAEERALVVVVQDNGVGIDREALAGLRERLEEEARYPERLPPGSAEGTLTGRRRGIGLRNVRTRLYIHFREQCRFEITSEPGEGTVVRIAIPLHVQRDGGESA